MVRGGLRSRCLSSVESERIVQPCVLKKRLLSGNEFKEHSEGQKILPTWDGASDGSEGGGTGYGPGCQCVTAVTFQETKADAIPEAETPGEF